MDFPGLGGTEAGIGASVSTTPTLTYRTHANSTANATTYTFSSQSIGTAAADRVVIVSVNHSGGVETVSTVKVGGISATKAIGALKSVSSSRSSTSEIWYAAVPTGTTASIVVTMTGTNANCGIGVWSMTGQTSNMPAATASDTTLSSDKLDVNLNTQIGDVIVAVAMNSDAAGPFTHAWVGATERFDSNTDTDMQKSGADFTCVAAQTPRSINVTISSTPGGAAAVAASWR